MCNIHFTGISVDVEELKKDIVYAVVDQGKHIFKLFYLLTKNPFRHFVFESVTNVHTTCILDLIPMKILDVDASQYGGIESEDEEEDELDDEEEDSHEGMNSLGSPL